MIDETAAEIQEMQTHSSSIVAIKAARALETILDRSFATVEEFYRDLDRNADALRRANRSHATLHNAMTSIVDGVTSSEVDTVEEAKKTAKETIDTVIHKIETGKQGAAENLASTLSDGDTILTHDYSSTVIEGISIATSDNKKLTVFVTEARPRCIGRKSARELSANEDVDVTLITDSAGGYYLEECSRVVVGMDCIVNGVLYNRIGTFSLAATADYCDVPVTVVGSAAKVITTGFEFKNEFRPTSEVIREPIEGFSVSNPNYDATPLSLVSEVITDGGQCTPESLISQ